MVLSKVSWILTYIPFIPPQPFRLGLSFWVLLPQNEGEKVLYLVLSSYFVQFEEKITKLRNGFFEVILKGVLKMAYHTSDYCCTRIDAQKLVEL